MLTAALLMTPSHSEGRGLGYRWVRNRASGNRCGTAAAAATAADPEVVEGAYRPVAGLRDGRSAAAPRYCPGILAWTIQPGRAESCPQTYRQRVSCEQAGGHVWLAKEDVAARGWQGEVHHERSVVSHQRSLEQGLAERHRGDWLA